MDFRVLKYFLTVAREGSMTGAAKFLHVTQPTLSRQLKILEEDLGKKLFIRTNHRLKLTDEGMLLRKRAEDIISMVEKTEQEFLTMDNLTGGDVYISAGETDAFKYFAQVAIKLKDQYPYMRYHLHSGNSQDVMERLDNGLVDFGIVVDPVDLSKYNYITLPSKDTWGIIMREDNPLAEKQSITIKDLESVPLILPKQVSQHAKMQNEFSDWLGESYDKLNIIATFTLGFNPFIMVREGFGCTLSFDKMVNNVTENNLIFRPLEPKLESGLHVIWKKYQVFSPAAELFLNALKKFLL